MGGEQETLSGGDLILATFAMKDPLGNEIDPRTVVGCLERYWTPLHGRKPIQIDLTKVGACCAAIDNHVAAEKAEADFVFEKGIKLFGSEQPTTAALRHRLKVQEMHTRDDAGRASVHDEIVQAQTDLEALCQSCMDCCEQVLDTRDAAITFADIGAE